jgi:hypothetical protein
LCRSDPTESAGPSLLKAKTGGCEYPASIPSLAANDYSHSMIQRLCYPLKLEKTTFSNKELA